MESRGPPIVWARKGHHLGSEEYRRVSLQSLARTDAFGTCDPRPCRFKYTLYNIRGTPSKRVLPPAIGTDTVYMNGYSSKIPASSGNCSGWSRVKVTLPGRDRSRSSKRRICRFEVTSKCCFDAKRSDKVRSGSYLPAYRPGARGRNVEHVRCEWRIPVSLRV